MDLYLGVLSIRKNRTTGRYLGLACIGASIVDLSYLISILTNVARILPPLQVVR